MTITLYKFGPQWGINDPSPFCLKLESYLKIANIDYDAPPFDVSVFKKAPKGKLPFVDLGGGQLLGDSNLIMDHFITEGAHNPDAPLTVEQKALSLAFRRLIEDSLLWVLFFCRWKEEPGWSVVRDVFFKDLPALLRPFIENAQQKKMWNKAKAQGIGLHTPEEIHRIGERDIQALSDFLGEKTYAFETEEPAILDITMHAFAANVLRPPIENQLKTALQSKANLVAHFERVENFIGS